MVDNHGDRKSPKDQVVGPHPNGLFMAYTYKWGVILTTYTYKSWDDPPSIGSKNHDVKAGGLEGHGIFPQKNGENKEMFETTT